MCTTCGCGAEEHHDAHDHDDDHDHHHHAHDHAHDAAVRIVRMERALLAKNDDIAAVNRLAAGRVGIAMWNLIGAPGAGKTALLEALVRKLRGEVPIAVLEGDQATDNDAKRIETAGCPVVQINTGTGCHLDASMVERGLQALAPRPGSFVFVENVGNLVCPALFDLGELAKIVVVSVTEGEDKPLKYPHVFRAARVVVLTKMDLAQHAAFDDGRFVTSLHAVTGTRVALMRVSAKAGTGIDVLARWFREDAARARAYFAETSP